VKPEKQEGEILGYRKNTRRSKCGGY